MSTYVLVHGAWHGGWCWSKVRRVLEAADRNVYSPTLMALGERSHLASPDIGLQTHVQDVLQVLEYEALTDVVLVGLVALEWSSRRWQTELRGDCRGSCIRTPSSREAGSVSSTVPGRTLAGG